MTYKILDLFSGIGGFSLGLERSGMETVAFCEIEPFCQQVLRKHWPKTPIASDIDKLNYKDGVLYDGTTKIYKGKIDLICGGFPCQPFSVAGRKKGTQDNRDLWPQMFRLIQECQPTWVIGENVANFLNLAFTRTKIDLEGEGYTVQPFIIPACGVEAPHKRDRAWIIAHSNGNGWKSTEAQKPLEEGRKAETCEFHLSNMSWGSEFRASSRVRRVCDGLPDGMDRVKSLGNAVVPQVVEQIGKSIMHLSLDK